jgi:hypothetical protein
MLQPTAAPAHAARSSLVLRLAGLVGCLAVAAIHIIDQGGVPGSKSPDYIQISYYLLEIAAVVAAALLASFVRWGWMISLVVAAGPILGYVLSRGPGLPDYTDDIGNWAEPLGILSLVIEGTLLILAATSLRRQTGNRSAASAHRPAKNIRSTDRRGGVTCSRSNVK